MHKMADRSVTKSRKDGDGDITALCDSTSYWSPRMKSDAISDIESNQHTYTVTWRDGKRTPVRVVQGPTGKYLRSDRDDTSKNNLDELPDC